MTTVLLDSTQFNHVNLMGFTSPLHDPRTFVWSIFENVDVTTSHNNITFKVKYQFMIFYIKGK